MKKKPSKKQLEFLSWEFGAFFHFGIRTFYPGHKDWDGKEMPLSVFLPEDLDCRDWIRTIRDAGMKYAVFTAKHHDGFANWPSKYTDYNISSTSWKDGRGDVVADYVEACREFGIRVGLYYSPADAEGKKKTDQEYDDYFIHQISELLSDYGKIDYLWFDGCGSEGHVYDTDRIVRVIRELQPDILLFNMWDPDTRWIGNEAGISPAPCYYTVSSLDFSVLTEEKDQLSEKTFLPPECDARIRYSTWFAAEDDGDTVKSVEELMGMYELSVGRGANFLLNIAPDRSGRLAEPDAGRLEEFGQALKQRFQKPMAVFDRPQPVPGENRYEICPDRQILADCVVMEEDIAEGQAVLEYRIYADQPFFGRPVLVYQGYQIGHKAICRFPAVRTEKLILEIVKQDGDCTMAGVQIYGRRL